MGEMDVLHSEITWLKAAEKLSVQIFCIAWCSNYLTICRGTFLHGAAQGLEMQMFVKFI